MQNTVKTVNMLPNLPSELDIVVLQLSNQVEGDLQFQCQFRTDFQVCKKHVITQLWYLKDNYPNYCYIIISLDRINALLVDKDVSSLFTAVGRIVTALTQLLVTVADCKPWLRTVDRSEDSYSGLPLLWGSCNIKF